MAAHAAARGIRELDPAVDIALLSAEPHPPYARPPLSKKLWAGGQESSIWLEEVPGLTLLLGRRAVALDPVAREVTDDRGAPRELPWKDERIVHFRTVADFRRVRDALAAGARRVVVVGGGFIGSEIAASLAANGAAVTMIFPKEAICARAFPPDLARFVTEYYRDKGVVIWSREKLAQLTQRADGLALRTVGGQETVADLVVAGLGIVPSAELAQKAGLAVGDGIQVDAGLRTSDPAIWAAGDVASFVSPALEKRVRVEHEDNALTMGRLAGRAMAGDAVSYQHLPFFYSDLFDLGYEAVGELDARHEVVSDWKLPFREGIVYFLSRGRVRGVLLWNVWGQVEAARALIRDERPASIRGPLALPDASGTASV